MNTILMRTSVFLMFLSSCICVLQAQTKEDKNISPLTRKYIYPTRVIWQSGNIAHADYLLAQGNGQPSLRNDKVVVFKNKDSVQSSILLDFGKELHGAVELVTGMYGGGNTPRNIRVRLGESVSEAMSDIGVKGATNDHAMRDFRMQLPWLGKNQTGESGFRFVRIDLLDKDAELQLREVRAIFTYRDIPYLGSFKSSDERLNKIWEVGAYTVHLNMQDYLWDGIKRDRLVWVGDMHPEVATINAVFGYNEVVPKSLDLARDITPLPEWMSGFSAYSMWWIILHYDWYMHHGDLDYLKQQQPYLSGLVKQITSKVGEDGIERMDGRRFLDWPSSRDTAAIHAGLQGLCVWSLDRAAELAKVLGDDQTQQLAEQAVNRLKKHRPSMGKSKQAAALLSLTDMVPAKVADKDVLVVDGAKDFSTFYGYYMLQAMAKADNYDGALDIIRTYWGAMLDLGATTFWEDFNMDWLPNASRIDELVPDGKKDIHGDYGDHCYVGFRHSFCHGWASGPTAWLSEHVLGVKVVKPGGQEYRIEPHLGNLEFVEGTYPTKYGVITLEHRKDKNGKVVSKIRAPKGVKIIQ